MSGRRCCICMMDRRLFSHEWHDPLTWSLYIVFAIVLLALTRMSCLDGVGHASEDVLVVE